MQGIANVFYPGNIVFPIQERMGMVRILRRYLSKTEDGMNMKMKRLFPLFLLFGTLVWTQAAMAAGELNLTVKPDQVLCKDFIGLGCQGDSMMTTYVNKERGLDAEDIELVHERVRAMRPHVMRTFFSYPWWEPEKGKQTPDGEFMKDYVEWASFLKSINCKINLCPWGDWFAYSAWMKVDSDWRLPSPDMEKEVVRSLVDLVEYLKRDQGLDNITQVTLMNEPDNSWRIPAPKDFIRMNRLLDEELKKRHLRDGIMLLGMDGSNWANTEQGEWFYDVAAEGGCDYFDGASFHTYGQSFTCPTINDFILSRRQALDTFGGADKPLMITEFGCFGPSRGGIFTMTDNDKFDYGLFLARFAVESLRRGVSNVMMWCLFDTYYDSLNKQEAGLWRNMDEDWEPRPGFYSWSLLTRYTRPGSKVFAVTGEPDDIGNQTPAVALLSPSGEWTLLIVNSQVNPTPVTINLNAPADLALAQFEYTRKSVPTVDRGMLLPAAEISVKAGGAFQLQLPPESLVVLTNVDQQIREAAQDILKVERPWVPFYHPERAMIIAPDADTAAQLNRMIKPQRPDFWVITFDPAYKNEVPLPENNMLRHMIGAVTYAYVVEPGKGYPPELAEGLRLTPVGKHLYRMEPADRDRDQFPRD